MAENLIFFCPFQIFSATKNDCSNFPLGAKHSYDPYFKISLENFLRDPNYKIEFVLNNKSSDIF